MPQATFLCVDSSDYMRNGDYSPNRIMAVQETCSLLTEALMQRNPENVIGFLTFGGKSCTVRETLTEDTDRVTGSLASIAVGGESQFGYGIQIAMLALSHVKNTRSEKQIVAFVGSPIVDSADRLKQLAKTLRKDEVSISIMSLGCPDNTPVLQTFVDQVGKNAYLYVVPENASVVDFLFTTSLMGGDGTGGGGGAGVGMGGMGGGPEAEDPQFAMAVRASMEEQQRLEAQQAAAQAASAQQQPQQPTGQDAAPSTAAGAASAEDDLELALRLSMEEALREQQQADQQQSGGGASSSSTTVQQDSAGASSSGGGGAPPTASHANDIAEFEAALADPEVMKALQEIAESDDKKKPTGSDDKKKGDDSGDKPPPSS